MYQHPSLGLLIRAPASGTKRSTYNSCSYTVVVKRDRSTIVVLHPDDLNGLRGVIGYRLAVSDPQFVSIQVVQRTLQCSLETVPCSGSLRFQVDVLALEVHTCYNIAVVGFLQLTLLGQFQDSVGQCVLRRPEERRVSLVHSRTTQSSTGGSILGLSTRYNI